MKLIYTKQGTAVKGHSGGCRNAGYFEGVESVATEVVIVGDYPNIKEAYEKDEISVTVLGAESSNLNKKTVDELKQLLEANGIEFDPKAKKEELLELAQNVG